MSKIKLGCVVFLLLSVTSLFSDMKRYEVKSGEILYEISGDGSMMGMPVKVSGDASVIFKNYGSIELSKEKTIQTMMGQKELEESITKFDNGMVYSVDNEEKVIFKQQVPMDPEDLSMAKKGEESLKSLGGKKTGSDKVAGFKCDIWELSGVKMCIYKGVPLKTETNTMGLKQIQIAKSAKFDISISDAKFELPNYPVKSRADMMGEAMKQMENMSPEQKKMMQDMMKNMGGMMGGQQ